MQIEEESVRSGRIGLADWMELTGRPMAGTTFLEPERICKQVVSAISASFLRLVTHGPRNLSRRAVLVRHAEQVHRHPFHRQAEREESRGAVEELTIRVAATDRSSRVINVLPCEIIRYGKQAQMRNLHSHKARASLVK